MDPVTGTILAAIAQAFAGAGIQQALPKHSMTQPMQTPQLDDKQIDFQRLVGQQQSSQLPKLQLQNRLPRPY